MAQSDSGRKILVHDNSRVSSSKCIAIIQTKSKNYASEQNELCKELIAIGYRVHIFNPKAKKDDSFHPDRYILVVNRLSATAYDVSGETLVFKKVYNWLKDAEDTIGQERVVNGVHAFQFDTSKIEQWKILEKLALSPPTKSYQTLDAIAKDTFFQSQGDDLVIKTNSSPIFIKLAAGGSGKGTYVYSNINELKESIEANTFPNVVSKEKGSERESDSFQKRTLKRQFTVTLTRLENNIKALASAYSKTVNSYSKHSIIVQKAVIHDKQEAVYARLIQRIEIQLSKESNQQRRDELLDRLRSSRWVLRVECFNYEIKYGAWMATDGTNFCHAGPCSLLRPFEEMWLANETCPIPNPVAMLSKEIAREAGMKLAGIEWIRDESGKWWVIDINGMSIFRTEAYPNELKSDNWKSPWRQLAEYLNDLVSSHT